MQKLNVLVVDAEGLLHGQLTTGLALSGERENTVVVRANNHTRSLGGAFELMPHPHLCICVSEPRDNDYGYLAIEKVHKRCGGSVFIVVIIRTESGTEFITDFTDAVMKNGANYWLTTRYGQAHEKMLWMIKGFLANMGIRESHAQREHLASLAAIGVENISELGTE